MGEGGAWDVLVANARGDTLFSALPGRSLASEEWLAAGISSPDGTARAVSARMDGESVLVTRLSGSLNGWQYAAVDKISELYHASRTLLRFTLCVSAFLLLCALGASCFMSRRYYKPIQALSAFTAEKARAEAKKPGSELDAIRENVRDMAAEKDMLEREMALSRAALREHFILRLLLGRDMDLSALRAEMNDYGLSLPEPLGVLIVRLTRPQRAGGRLCDICREALAPYAQGEAIDFDPRDCVVLYGRGGEMLGRRIAERILSDMKGAAQGSAVVGIGETANDVSELHLSYRGAEEVLQYAGMAGDNGILYIGDVRARGESAADIAAMEKRMNDICTAARQGDGALARARAQEALDALWACERFSYSYRNILLMRLIDRLMMILVERGIEHALTPAGGNPFAVLARMSSRDEITAWLTQTVDEIAALTARQQQNRMHDAITRVCESIQQDYAQPLSVQSLADTVHLNPNYMGRLFREYTGETVLEYITRVRLDAASRLLLEKRLTINDVAQRAGFGTRLNMIRAFKKHLGRTPTEQRAFLERE